MCLPWSPVLPRIRSWGGVENRLHTVHSYLDWSCYGGMYVSVCPQRVCVVGVTPKGNSSLHNTVSLPAVSARRFSTAHKVTLSLLQRDSNLGDHGSSKSTSRIRVGTKNGLQVSAPSIRRLPNLQKWFGQKTNSAATTFPASKTFLGVLGKAPFCGTQRHEAGLPGHTPSAATFIL